MTPIPCLIMMLIFVCLKSVVFLSAVSFSFATTNLMLDIFMVMEAMIDSGVHMGFSRETATTLVHHTLLGT